MPDKPRKLKTFKRLTKPRKLKETGWTAMPTTEELSSGKLSVSKMQNRLKRLKSAASSGADPIKIANFAEQEASIANEIIEHEDRFSLAQLAQATKLMAGAREVLSRAVPTRKAKEILGPRTGATPAEQERLKAQKQREIFPGREEQLLDERMNMRAVDHVQMSMPGRPRKGFKGGGHIRLFDKDVMRQRPDVTLPDTGLEENTPQIRGPSAQPIMRSLSKLKGIPYMNSTIVKVNGPVKLNQAYAGLNKLRARFGNFRGKRQAASRARKFKQFQVWNVRANEIAQKIEAAQQVIQDNSVVLTLSNGKTLSASSTLVNALQMVDRAASRVEAIKKSQQDAVPDLDRVVSVGKVVRILDSKTMEERSEFVGQRVTLREARAIEEAKRKSSSTASKSIKTALTKSASGSKKRNAGSKSGGSVKVKSFQRKGKTVKSTTRKKATRKKK